MVGMEPNLRFNLAARWLPGDLLQAAYQGDAGKVGIWLRLRHGGKTEISLVAETWCELEVSSFLKTAGAEKMLTMYHAYTVLVLCKFSPKLVAWKVSQFAADKTDRLLGLSAAHLAAEQGHVAVLKAQSILNKICALQKLMKSL